MIEVIKESGKKERFNKQKIIRSSMKAGATRKFAKEISETIAHNAHNKITTKKIHQQTAKLLSKNTHIACRYKLKRAVMSLGPSGFPFEQFFARILQEHGFTTHVGTIMKGNATTHEVDIIAKRKETIMIECKFHNKPGTKTDTKVAMYTHARFLDLQNNKENGFTSDWLVTNTTCTDHAIEYAKGVGLRVTQWETSTKGAGLQQLIEEKALYPITLFENVKGTIKEQLFKHGLVFAKDLLEEDKKTIAKRTGIPINSLKKIMDASAQICIPKTL